MELLEVTEEQLAHRLVLRCGGSEDIPPQLVQRNPRQTCHPLGSIPILFGTGGGFEHHCVGNNGRGHQPRHLLGGHDPPLLEHPGHDGGGAAHRLIAEPDGIVGLDIRQAVVINDLQNIRLIQSGNGLSHLVVVHQHHPFAPRADQMEAGQGPHHLILLIQDRVAAVTALEHYLPHVVNIVVQAKILDIVPAADTAGGDCLEHHAHSPVGVIGGCDDTGIAPLLPQIRRQFRLAQDNTADAHLHGRPDSLRLTAADEDRFLLPEGILIQPAGQSNNHPAGEHVHRVGRLIEELPLQHTEKIEKRNVLNRLICDVAHIVFRHISGGQHSHQLPLVIGNRDGRNMPVVLHGRPGPVHRHRLIEDGRRIEVQVLNLGTHIFHQQGRIKAKPLQYAPGFVAELPQPGRHILPVPHSVAQGGIGHGGHNRIRVRVAVSSYINLVQRGLPPVI